MMPTSSPVTVSASPTASARCGWSQRSGEIFPVDFQHLLMCHLHEDVFKHVKNLDSNKTCSFEVLLMCLLSQARNALQLHALKRAEGPVAADWTQCGGGKWKAFLKEEG